MRERFELAVKIIGLVLVCGGILLLAGAVFRLFWEPDWSSYVDPWIPDSARDTAAPMLARLDDVMSSGWKHILADMAVQGLLPIALGLYLLCSGRWVVEWAYPGGEAAGRLGSSAALGAGEPTPEVPPSAETTPKADDRRYAPPGMYENEQ